MNALMNQPLDQLNADIQRVFALQQSKAVQWRGSTAEERIARIERLRDAVLARREEIINASTADMRRPAFETELIEVNGIIGEAEHTIRHLKQWMKTRKVRTPLFFFGTTSQVRLEPKGVCLILGPWNVPHISALGPLISALAAGNTCFVRPSEMAPASARVIVQLIRDVFPEDEVAAYDGGPEVAQLLTALPFNHIFFTGSPTVGKLVMKAAADHLCSVTLELGGKSPVVIDATANMTKTVRSIAYTKLLNCGQACTAPDYILVHESIEQEFLAELKALIKTRIGDSAQAQQQSPDLGRVITDKHWQRITGLVTDAIAKGGQIVFGGESDAAQRYIQPTVLRAVPQSANIFHEEIFGPVVPVMTYRTLDEAITYINARPKPLAAYIYSEDNQAIERFIAETSSGDVGVNVAMLHYGNNNLPFGGANNSGLGKAHGEWGFKAFSHERAIMRDHFASTHMLAPPYTDKSWRLARLMRRFS
ncbi:MAG: aldehyde dehydrogenase family protein [Stenotrophobium sp.]